MNADRKVIDLKTGEPWRIEQHEPTEEERQAAFENVCMDAIFLNAVKIKAVAGMDRALRALHQAAQDLKEYGRK